MSTAVNDMNQNYEPMVTAKSLIFNLITFFNVVLASILVSVLDIPIHQSGFFCGDTTIQYPYKEDTVTVLELFIFTMGPAFTIIVVSEFRRFLTQRKMATQNMWVANTESGSHVQERLTLWKIWLLRTVLQIIFLVFGTALTVLAVQMFKHSLGRLRPHFLNVCQPKPGSFDCVTDHEYIEDYVCQQKDQKLVKNARKSFVSGHAAVAFYFMMFASTYVSKRTPKLYSLPKAMIQVFNLTVAGFIGVTRITDNAHHPEDVVAGGLLGALIGYLTAKRISGVVSFKYWDGTSPPYLLDIKSGVS